MTVIIAILTALAVWSVGYAMGVKKALKRAKKAVKTPDFDTRNPINQQYRRIVSDTGFVWYEVKPL